ncbi:DUF1707 domain-containing protein [Kribbella sp. NPDC004875]|uniref:DUF1707 SHOCT-like domain-containing protein n=1 Tax=Kribbella sp. NPDC004875 TaxID=3364107 RepID=UPI00367CEF26
MSEERPGGSIRIGDSEREDAVRRLGEHYEAGRLSADEHSERVEQALKAKTAADLNGLFADLPREQPAAAGASGPWKPPFAGRGPLSKVPLPLLVALGAIGVLASIGCVVGGGHPPILPLALIVAAVFVVRKRRMERRA